MGNERANSIFMATYREPSPDENGIIPNSKMTCEQRRAFIKVYKYNSNVFDNSCLDRPNTKTSGILRTLNYLMKNCRKYAYPDSVLVDLNNHNKVVVAQSCIA
jgi:hypothetical protein